MVIAALTTDTGRWNEDNKESSWSEIDTKMQQKNINYYYGTVFRFILKKVDMEILIEYNVP